jgi:1-acyl-sn-glycerol-3-phosphate acyltransferase
MLPARTMLIPLKSRLSTLYNLWCWLWFLFVLTTFGLMILILPGLRLRQHIARLGMRFTWTLCHLRPTVSGLAHLPSGTAIVVANHVSYLDGLLLTGVLPAGYVFVAKHEMSQVPLASWLLRRLGIAFVNREKPAQGARDARSILRRAQQGTSFAFFPEGTIPRGGALGPFRLGAFLTAAELQCPVVPISLEGTERVMPDDHRWRVYHHPIRVRIHAPIHPKGRNRPDLAWLRDQARMRIARSLEAEASPHHAESARRDRNTG